jgi:hypothetical protein
MKGLFAHMFKNEFQLLPLKYSTDVSWRHIYRDMCKLQLMLQLLQDKPTVVFKMTERHRTGRIRWKRSWTDSCLSDVSAWGVHILAFPISWSDRSRFFLWGFAIGDVYVPPVPVILNNFVHRIRTATEKLISIYCKMFGTNRISSCVQSNKWST